MAEWLGGRLQNALQRFDPVLTPLYVASLLKLVYNWQQRAPAHQGPLPFLTNKVVAFSDAEIIHTVYSI